MNPLRGNYFWGSNPVSIVLSEGTLLVFLCETHTCVCACMYVLLLCCIRYLNCFWRDSSRHLSVYNDGNIIETRAYKTRSVRHIMGAREQYTSTIHTVRPTVVAHRCRHNIKCLISLYRYLVSLSGGSPDKWWKGRSSGLYHHIDSNNNNPFIDVDLIFIESLRFEMVKIAVLSKVFLTYLFVM